MSIVLGIETSCDETGIAVVRDGHEVLSNVVASQIPLHQAFGGVVPEMASREHTKAIGRLTEQALAQAKTPIDAIAATNGPGLAGSLYVGVCFAKALAFAWDKPFVPVHHIEGHIFSVFLTDHAPAWPFLALVVSGGHTLLAACERPHHYRLLGSTRDDAVGECFDKVARVLGLAYPGGPAIQAVAQTGNRSAYSFPRGLGEKDTLDFSYSGLKTAVLYAVRDGATGTEDLAASFQEAAVDVLITKTRQALVQTGLERVVVAGGVAANARLRERLAELDADVFVPPVSLCVDNGAMIAAAGASRFAHGYLGSSQTMPRASWPLCEEASAGQR